ncbi:hypothetical protein GMMP15_540004 [Candidatus Magnetomoraceae bacterium gMMP-15]
MRLGQKFSIAVNKTNKAFHALVETIVKIEQLVGEIVEANNEQTIGIEQLNKTLYAIDRLTQENASQYKEYTNISQELNTQALNMKQIVNELSALIEGGEFKPDFKNYQEIETPKQQHEISSQPKKKQPSQIKSDHLLPMDREAEFEDF